MTPADSDPRTVELSAIQSSAAKPRVAFVEAKEPDWDAVKRHCAASREHGHWANFGPGCEALGEDIASAVQLEADRVAVPASSATTALHALVGLEAERSGRPLKWLVSGFGFFSTAIGPLAETVAVVDCDEDGMLDLSAAARLAPGDWDGMIVTDALGQHASLDAYASFCAERDKPLLVDAAASFRPASSLPAFSNAIMSFHHTKPWGFGEGGCAFVRRQDADTVRSFLNFGVGTSGRHLRFAGNGKLSDPSAAFIRDRLARRSEWSQGYLIQRARISRLVQGAGHHILGAPPETAVTAYVPVLAPSPIRLDELPRSAFGLTRYYRPLAPDLPIANDLYARLVNIPCHPGMADVRDNEINAVLHAMRPEP